MISQSVQAEIAAPLGLWVHMGGSIVTELLEELLATAIRSAPTSRILLVAAHHGDHIYISVTDDMPGADASVRRASVCGLIQRVEMLGGRLDVEVQPSEGTKMTLRLAAAHDDHNRLPQPKASASVPSVITKSVFSS